MLPAGQGSSELVYLWRYFFKKNRAEILLVLGPRQSGASSCTGRSILSYRTEGSGPWWVRVPRSEQRASLRGAGGNKVRLCGVGEGGAVSSSHTCLFVGPSRRLPFFSSV